MTPVPESAAGPGGHMAAETREQPDVLARVCDEGVGPARSLAARLRDASPRFVTLAARGTSDHAALYAKYLVEVGIGLPAGLASPSTVTTFGGRPRLADTLWVAVSQSGGSPDLVEATAVARECGALTVAVTNTPGSPLADAAAYHLDVLAGPERAVAATKTYTAQLLTLWLLVDAWRGGDAAAARALPQAAAHVLDTVDVDPLVDRLRGVDALVTTGRGYAYPTAAEAALKLMETAYVSAHAFSAADLLHGPLAVVDRDRPVLAVVPSGVGGRAMGPLLHRLDVLGADVTVFGDGGVAGTEVRVVPLPADVGEDLAPVLQILPLQRLAHALALARGADPDAPRALRKVTETW